ncbi:hypothetical protein E2542_SST24727 [Spatholobus suberectus]|nr:hypothetical protein E2542_SST24727 [Spatholobus suberectus]
MRWKVKDGKRGVRDALNDSSTKVLKSSPAPLLSPNLAAAAAFVPGSPTPSQVVFLHSLPIFCFLLPEFKYLRLRKKKSQILMVKLLEAICAVVGDGDFFVPAAIGQWRCL